MKELENKIDWLSAEWFEWGTFKSFQYEYPIFLYAIPAVVLLFLLRELFVSFYRRKLSIATFSGKLSFDPTSLLRIIPMLVFASFITLVLVALARPQRVDEQVERWTEGIDIMLILDASSSMELQDFKPNRLEAAKRVAKEFIEGRKQDRIGLVVFAGESYSLSPLTSDYELLFKLLKDIKLNMIPQDGTAIGSALGVALNRMQSSDAKSKVIILLSDGDNNAGNIDPVTAAEIAYAYGIKLYTIGIGKDGKVPYGKNFFGMTQYVEARLNESTLREIAKIGEGQFFRASNNKALKKIFKKIDEYEKSEIKENRFKNTQDYYYIYLLWALVVFAFWMLLKNSFVSNWIED